MKTDFQEGIFPKTKLVEKRLEDFRNATENLIGKSKFKGSIKDDIDSDYIFGLRSIKGDDHWNLGKCLHGDPNNRNSSLFEPDRDLGKSVIFKSKLNSIQPKEYDQSRIFGVPSIRYDLPKKRNASVGDINVDFIL